MMDIRRPLALVAGTFLLVTSAALAYVPDPESQSLEIPLPQYGLIQGPDQHYAVEDARELMAQRYGGQWQVGQWNQFSRSPESLYGSGVQLTSSDVLDDQAAAATTLSFVAANPEILRARADDLALDRVVRGVGKVAVHLAQQHHGIPVLGGRVRAVYTDGGRLFFLGSSFYGDIDVNPVPYVSALQAQSIAQNGLPFDLATDRVEGEPKLLVLPVPLDEGGAEYHLVWRVEVFTQTPQGLWVSHVDAHAGEIVYRYNDVHHIYSGTSEGDVDDAGYCDGMVTLPFREMTINVAGVGNTVTGADGSFSIPGSAGAQTLTAQFDGPQQNVNNQAGPDASLSIPIQDGVPLTVNFDDVNSNRAERDAFYWINETDAFVKGIDNTYNHSKYTVNVNVNSTCNANWGGNVMNFFREGGGCANTGTIGDVMAHEFGHGVQADLLGSQGDQGLGEGNSDILGSLMIDDSVIGRGFYLNDCTQGIRDCDNTLSYPGDVVGQPIHSAGRVICGFNWDARLALEASLGTAAGKAKIAELWHYARKLLLPFNQPDQVLAYFITDDDDGNLDNGTPHHAELCLGATNHGFECPEILTGVIITHTPLRSTTNHVTDYIVEATITSTEGTVTSATLFYQINGAANVQVPMTNDGGDSYTAAIPAQASDAAIDYYLFAEDNQTNIRTSPATAPTTMHSFLVATVIDELEAASGWTVGAPDDNATTGIWERVDPIGTEAQPGDDHTPDPGVLAFVTGQCSGPLCPTCSLGCNDVDNGKTTLFSPVWDLSAAIQMAKLRYWRWYSNNTGASPNADNWVVDVSNDGGTTWVSVENVNPPSSEQNRWIEIEVDLIALFGAPDQVQLRFVASDLGSGSLVEAAVDDVVVLTSAAPAAVESAAAADAPLRLTVAEPSPNPFNPATSISYEVPASGQVLMEVFDTSGRRIRTLVDGFAEAGSHTIRWDGRDDGGALTASGVYHLKVIAGDQTATRKLVLLK